MAELESQLRKILERELDIYLKILELAREKTEILKQSDVDRLEGLTLEERQILLEVNSLEEKREETIRGLAKKLGISQKLDLSSMADYFSESEKEQFKEVRKKLQEVIDQLQNTNKLNETLIKDSLEYIDFSLNLMTSTSVEGNYGQNAVEMESREGLSKKSLFDGKA